MENLSCKINKEIENKLVLYLEKAYNDLKAYLEVYKAKDAIQQSVTIPLIRDKARQAALEAFYGDKGAINGP